MINMELNKRLNNLTQRTWQLHRKLNERIDHHDYQSASFCEHCCIFAESIEEVEERQALIPIRDSIKDVQDMLLFVQKNESIKEQDESAAFAGLEASRRLLLEIIKQHPRPGNGEGREVLEELKDVFGDGRTGFSWEFKKREEKNVAAKQGTGRWSLFHPRNWFSTVRIGMVLVALCVGVSSRINLGNTQRRRIVLPNKFQVSSLKNDGLTAKLDVMFGRG